MLREFFVAQQFLSRLPVKVANVREEEFGRSLLYFPLVGLLLGAISGVCFLVFASIFPRMVACALTLAIYTILTGAIHLDGFADTIDGLCGSRDREEALRIMRDSRIGVMGVTGLVLLLLLKFALLENISSDMMVKAWIALCALSRYIQVFVIYTARYVRQEGKAKPFFDKIGEREFYGACFITLAIALFTFGFKGISLFSFVLFFGWLVIKYIKKRLGGMTGDTIGGISELVEIMTLLAIVMFRWG